MQLRRSALLLALSTLAACQWAPAGSLREEDARAELSQRLFATLDKQDHYFEDSDEGEKFAERLQDIALSTTDAPTYYRGLADALAALDEGHTGLVASPEVPFSSTIPPVAILEADQQPVVAGVAPGIEGGGLLPGDVILEVDGEPAHRVIERREKTTGGSTLHARRARAVANLLAGPTNTPAEVRVRGPNGRERHCFPLRFLLDDEGEDRFRFGFLPRQVKVVRISAKAGYVAFPDFHPERRKELVDAFPTVRELPQLVLDLRGNPGGRIRTLERVAGLFLEGRREMLEVRTRGRIQAVRSEPGGALYRGQLLILVDERTGSAAELLAAALQDLGRATIYGRRTAGSARSRSSSVLPGGVVFHYAGKVEFRRRDGRRVEGVGVRPDVMVTPTREGLARGAYGAPDQDPMVRVALGLN